MDHVSVRALNQDTAGVLAKVENGETVEVTRRGRPIARIVPARSGELDDLVAAGRVVPATNHSRFPLPTVDAPDRGASAAVEADRDERW